jgi:quercetin dioxygenase-like cupin family protein
METVNDINAKIIAITLKIQEKYPELTKYLNELPFTMKDQNNPEINSKVLNEYYGSLNDLVKDYELEHSQPVLQSNPRPDSHRLLNAPILGFDLPAVIKRIKNEKEWFMGNHNAIALSKSKHMRIVLVAMHKGNEMVMNHIETATCIHVIEGKLKINAKNESHIFEQNQLLTLNENTKHEISAIEETVFLLTVINCG